MYPDIHSRTEYDNKLEHAELAVERKDWATALMYFQACQNYAEAHGMGTDYIEMKIRDVRKMRGY